MVTWSVKQFVYADRPNFIHYAIQFMCQSLIAQFNGDADAAIACLIATN